jgi:Ca2+-binding EF-hand superfamily protein
VPQIDLRQRKLTRMFSLYDRNGDGYVERGDYERVAQGFARVAGVASGSPEYLILEGAFIGFWKRLAQMSDQNEDGRVSLAEYLASHSQTVRASDAVMRITDTLIALTDRDRDGKVSRVEFTNNLLAYDMSPEDAATAFDHLDRDDDGYLTRDELLKNVDEFYGSDDPEAPGNWLAGPF